MRKDCQIWTCKCNLSFEGRAKFFEHRKTCEEYQIWFQGRFKRSQETRKKNLASLSLEERELIKKQNSERQKRVQGTPERRKEASERAVFNNFWKYRAKNPIFYESQFAGQIKLDSKWELLVAKRLDELNVEWYRPRIRLPYLDSNGVEHGYFPDFYVKTFNCFIEVKSPFIATWQNSQNKVDYLKSNYPFIKWIETEEDCKTFTLSDLQCPFVPNKDEEKIEFWLKKKSKTQDNSKKKKSPINSSLEQKRWELIQNSNINFQKYGWVKEIALIFGIAENKAGKYIKKHFPDFYRECFKRQ